MEPCGCNCGAIESGAFGVCLSLWAQSWGRQVSTADQTLFRGVEQSLGFSFKWRGTKRLKVVAQSNVINLLSFLCFRWMCWWIRLIFLYIAQTVFCLLILCPVLTISRLLSLVAGQLVFLLTTSSTKIFPCSALLTAAYLTYLYTFPSLGLLPAKYLDFV